MPVQRAADILFAAAGFSFNAQGDAGVEQPQQLFAFARAGKGEMHGRRGAYRHPAAGGLPQAIVVAALRRGQRQRDADRRLRQRRKKRGKGELAKLRRAQAELAHRQPVAGGEDVVGKDQQQLLDAVEFVHLPVQAHQPLLRMQTLFHPQIFNLLCRRFYPAKGVLVGKIRRAGDIQHPGDASVRSLERHRRAVQILVAGKKVLTAIDLAAIVNRQRGADGVGPAPAFTPQIAGSQRHALGLLQRLGIAESMQHQAVGVGKDHHRLQVCDLARQGFHHRLRQLLQAAVAGEPVRQLAGAEAGKILGGGIQPVALAARPRIAQQGIRINLWCEKKGIACHRAPLGRCCCVAIL